MRRNIKNDKVLRAITIGLATMIAVTSTPVTVFAEDGEPAAGEEQAGDKPEEKAGDKAEEGEKDNKEEKKEEQQQIPDDVKSATSGLQQAAENVETQKTTVDGQESVTGGIEAAKEAAGALIVPAGDGKYIKVEKHVDGKPETETETVDAETVKNDLVEAEKLLLNQKDETTGQEVGIYKDIEELQGAINNFYLANNSLDDMIDGFAEIVDENGETNVYFFGNKEKTIRYQVVTIPGVNPEDKPSYKVLKVEQDGTTNLATVDQAFDTEVENSRAQSQSQNAEAAITAASNANNASDINSARAYQNTALALVGQSEKEFGEDSEKFEEAKKFANDAQKNLADIKTQAEIVSEQLAAIKKEISDLYSEEEKDGQVVQGGKATALNEQLKAIEAKAKELKEKAEEEKKAISQYELLVKIQEADKNVRAEVEKNNADPDTSLTGGNYWNEARKLCYLLIEYYINNGDLAVTDAKGNVINVPDGGRLEIGANFNKQITYTAPDIGNDNNVIRKDAEGNDIDPKYGNKTVTKDYSIEGDGSSLFEFLSKDENGNFDKMAKRVIDDKENGMGWIFASDEKSYDYANNRVVVNIRDENDEIIGTAYFNAKTNDDGSVYIYKRECSEADDETFAGKGGVTGKEAVEAKAEVPESWSTEDNSKTLLVSDIEADDSTIHKININKDKADDGFYAIDTATSKDVSTDADKAEQAPVDTDDTANVTGGKKRTQVSYEEVEGSEKTDYVKGEYTVVDSYYKKTDDHEEHAVTKEDLQAIVDSYNSDGRTLSKVEVPIFWWSYPVDLNNVNWFAELCAGVNEFFGGDGLTIKISYEVDDTTRPKDTHSETGIYEIKTKDYKKTTIETENLKFESDGYGTQLFRRGKDKAEAARIAKIQALQEEGWTVTDSGLSEDLGDGELGWTYWVTYTKTTKKTEDIKDKVVSKIQYAADTYTNHTEHVDAVAAQAEVKEVIGYESYTTKKLVWTNDNDSQTVAKVNAEQGKVNGLAIAEEDDGNGGTKSRVYNTTNYKTLIKQLSDKQAAVEGYTDLYNKVKSASDAAGELLNKIKNFTYPSGSVATSDTPQADVQPDTPQATNYNFTMDNFDKYFWGTEDEKGLFDTLSEPVNIVLEYLSGAQTRREELERKIAEARAAVNAIDLSRFFTNDDDDDDDDDDSGVTPGAGTFVLPGAGASTLASFDLSGMTFDDGRGVAGARTGRRSVASTNSGSGVLGARTEGENKEPVVVNDTKNKDSKGATEKDNKKLEKIENNQLPLADAPFEEAFGLNWLWMVLAGAVGVGAYSYDRHRKKAAANEEMKKYKK